MCNYIQMVIKPLTADLPLAHALFNKLRNAAAAAAICSRFDPHEDTPPDTSIGKPSTNYCLALAA